MGALRTFVRIFILGRRRGLRSRARRRVWSMMGFTGAKESATGSAHGSHNPKDTREAADIPEGFTAVASVTELPPGTLMEAFVGDVAVAVGNVDGQLHAIGNTCPHAGGPLGDGALDGNAAVCPYHGWAFDLESGVCNLNDTVSVPVFAIREAGGQICVKI